ncbi:ABC transporter permease [Yinghuangia seranimata]|uniref:ABC transporter permease n=1 Tax=Yinghuangia seranimata TaxID=408067 RepID=UPI00248C99E6|nr:ABC transporter permease [Yinghuangia seranimata]MDI2132046.1 ABC transporter permease [Yinghuangia seranimata]
MSPSSTAALAPSASASDPDDGAPQTARKPGPPAGLTPTRLAWRRFRRDKVGVTAGAVVLLFFVAGLGAPLFAKLYGNDPYTTYGQNQPDLLNDYGFPVAPNGGISGDFWLGLEPGLGRDVLTQLLYGIRTSLLISLTVVVIVTVIGVVVGVTAGYLGGRTDYLVGRLIDVMLSFPSTLFFIAFTPVITSRLTSPGEQMSTLLRATILITVLATFGWASVARLLRGQVLSLRTREFVEAARAGGASPARIIFRELLPNLWTPILVSASLAVPTYVTTEAALSYLGVGMVEPTPDWGRMLLKGAEVYQTDLTYMFVPGISMLIFVIAFNLLGDSIRDALDPKTDR